ncbi:hypothetical protein PRK78_003626 [Emydomyces testavorans]|uniref:Cupin type-1 domain-containing protein n=1 Tax=Emydomyces testavorans TaxID=2070801 RepID=A0AAF0DH52_9EURO|nr:hypothetical protein PRK78_003626 [Emydomyces testavorans]
MSASKVERFYLQPTVYSPNSPLPVLLYRGVLPQPYTEESTSRFLEANDWEKKVRLLCRWSFLVGFLTFDLGEGTWGHIGTHHFHPNTHECYVAYDDVTEHGSSTLIIGRGRLDEKGGVYISVTAGDVIVIPAGTTHCSLESKGDYRYVGVYPTGSPRWRNEFGENPVKINTMRKEILRVEMPTQDPVYGKEGPLIGLWDEALRSFSKGGAAKL